MYQLAADPYNGSVVSGPSNPKGCAQVFYKPNNPQFAQQGGVSSSTRILKLNVDTISTAAAGVRKLKGANLAAQLVNGDPVNVPFIPFQITKITGISKEMVNQHGDVYDKFEKEMKDIMDYCYKPIFIAHNGNSFDHKIMIERKLLSYEDCKLLDSKIIIRLFLNDPVSDKSLSDIFQYLFKFKPVIHRANSDVRMMRDIFEKLNITEDKILNIK
jgi:DNA polymerase III epsilon subunit-like protein